MSVLRPTSPAPLPLRRPSTTLRVVPLPEPSSGRSCSDAHQLAEDAVTVGAGRLHLRWAAMPRR
jgi:hypothetical protein